MVGVLRVPCTPEHHGPRPTVHVTDDDREARSGAVCQLPCSRKVNCRTQPAILLPVVCAAQHSAGSAGRGGGRQGTSPPSWQSKCV